MSAAFDLERFIEAQEPVYATVLAELRAGRKRTHWMWLIFPQIAGLGHSPMAERYEIRSRAEAAAYLAHPVLGARLRECTRLVMLHRNKRLEEMFGYPDDLKFASSMTLFAQAADDSRFADALRQFGLEPDERTLVLLRR
jgi:uncharacterized protein (DUF1810 family)